MTNYFRITATWKTPGGNIGRWSGRWFGPDASTVRDAAADYLRGDKRRRIFGGLSVVAVLEK